ncbi:MAG: DUF2971 domain-containing protein, partial [Lachnospiraceae bacterium]|nr:DUF2971 domain-containing protein [Lachnospiraceae bacterium]
LEVLKCMFDNYSEENPFLTFWATNCAYMNDPREILEGIELVKDAISDIVDSNPSLQKRARFILENDKIKEALLIGSSVGKIGVPYSISFSCVKDNINMWRMYGQSGKGVALGFMDDKINVDGCELTRCMYYDDGNDKDQKEVFDLIKEIFQKWFAKPQKKAPSGISQEEYDFVRILEPIGEISPYFKNNAYKYEEEARLTTRCKTPQFRVANNILTPYTVIQLPIESLESIIIGPDCDERNINSLKVFFLSKGLNKIAGKIEQSEVPYRNC